METMLRVCVAVSLLLSALISYGATTRTRNEVVTSEKMLRLPSRSITWTRGINKELIDEAKSAQRDYVPVIVKFKKPLSLPNHEYLHTSGVRLEEYISDTSYVALVPTQLLLENGTLKNLVFSAQPLKPEDKIRLPAGANQYPKWAYDEQKKELKVLIAFWHSLDVKAVQRDLESLQLKAERVSADNAWAAVVDPKILPKIAALPSVKMIEPGPRPFVPLNNRGRRWANTDEAHQADFSVMRPLYRKVSGAGVHIAICDDGIDETHSDFAAVTAAGTAGASRMYKTRPASQFHGTHNASVAAGSGLRSRDIGRPAFHYAGHAPEAFIGDYPYFYDNPEEYFQAIVSERTDVSNHSYMQSETIYNSLAAGLDRLVRGDAKTLAGNLVPARPNVWGAGNNGITDRIPHSNEEGYYSVFTSAKNTISVGSIDTINGWLSGYSSLGPTFDGRIKPDVVAPGCFDSIPVDGVFAASNNSAQPYGAECGTSTAAPVVSGIIALMLQQYRKSFPAGPDLLPSLYKAILIHTARDMVKARPYDNPFEDPDNPDLMDPADPNVIAKTLYHAGPDYATGYGLVDAEGARSVIADGNLWTRGAINFTGHFQNWCIEVPRGTKELKVVIAWDDEPGSTTSPETTPKLVNDLDLELRAPNGTLHLPWTLDPLPLTATPGDGAPDPIVFADQKPAYRAADHRNNVEMVTVCSPMEGTWRANIKGFGIKLGSTQPYSLVSSHKILSWCLIGKQEVVLYKNVCEMFPKFCMGDFKCDPRLDISTGRITLRACGPIRIDEICKYVLNCPGCEGSSWSLCPGFQMNIEGLPEDALVVIFNDSGKILREDRAPLKARKFNVADINRGDRHFLYIANQDGNPLDRELNLKFEFQPN